MARYNYVALDSRGQEATGLVEATSTNDAIGRLRQAGYFPTSVYEEAVARADDKASRRRAAKMVRATKPRAKTGIVLFKRTKIKPKILMIFTRQLATLIDSGLPLVRSLTVLAKQERDKVLKNTINSLSDSVQGGNTFSDALALHPRIFNDLYVNMVKAGEIGGVHHRSRQHGEGWRDRWCTRAGAEPACGVSGESRQDQKQSKKRDGVSGYRDDYGSRDHGLPARVHCAEVRSDLPRYARR